MTAKCSAREDGSFQSSAVARNRGGLRVRFRRRGAPDGRKTNNRKVHRMKTLMNGLLKGRITRWGFLAVLLIAVGATVGWMDPKETHRQYQLGGGFIGSGGGGAGIWNALQIPLDPAGRTAALRVSTVTLSPQFAGLFAALGATAGGSDNVGEMEMINHDTARFGTVGYGREQAPGNPLQINTIFVMTGTVKFTGPDTIKVTYTINVYPALADADSDGYPDPGAKPILVPGVLPIQGVDYAKRVTLR